MQDGAIMLNQEGQITYLNAFAERLVHRERGSPREGLSGQFCHAAGGHKAR